MQQQQHSEEQGAIALPQNDEQQSRADVAVEALDAAISRMEKRARIVEKQRDALIEALEEAREFINDYIDVDDGDQPNKAMRIVGHIEEALRCCGITR